MAPETAEAEQEEVAADWHICFKEAQQSQSPVFRANEP